MQRLKENWDITRNWQLIYIFLGIVALLASGYFIAIKLIPTVFEDATYEYLFVAVVTLILAYFIYRLCIWIFQKLYKKWNVERRYRMIAIFLVFAITGSASARLSGPFLELFEIDLDHLSPWVFWPIRLLVIFPVYQILLVVIGWLFGQFDFFWWFEKKMLRRFGIKFDSE
ncbi:prolipoprotein diacylglyceryl transferase [Nonlabens spongiae]|uniref:Prolipoprotein diacylglyceryl transferase n=1 Tax=Nonlabens spongiae TaxID=331648 RepID=A0A1W6MJV6_9FLAO|nr:DUF6787 family protein [Nonlabens spongiae]ARN77880.1 prolipoprotein diacylglyceryl transferase [Nonlabens spongiae]